MFKITHERDKCIGCCACESIGPDSWEMGDDNKANLKGAKKKDGEEVFELEVEELKDNKEVAESCPVECVRVEDI